MHFHILDWATYKMGYTCNRTEENFGGKNIGEWTLLQSWRKKLWWMDLAADLAEWWNGQSLQEKL